MATSSDNTLTPGTTARRGAAADSPVGALRLRRRRSPLVPTLTALAAAGVLLVGRPAPAEAGPIYDMCVELVDGWYGDCSAGAGNEFQQFGCDWVAGVGYLACGIVGAGELGFPILMKELY